MFTPSETLNRRIVTRFLAAQSSGNSRPGRHAFVWHLPAPEPHIPDDFILQCSNGCTLTALEVEQMLPAKLKISPGSCRIKRVPADAQTNRTRFEVTTKDSRKITGTITVNIVASEQRIDAFSIVDVDARMGRTY